MLSFVLFSLSISNAASLEKGMGYCANIKDETKRLGCFDQVFRQATAVKTNVEKTPLSKSEVMDVMKKDPAGVVKRYNAMCQSRLIEGVKPRLLTLDVVNRHCVDENASEKRKQTCLFFHCAIDSGLCDNEESGDITISACMLSLE